MRSNPVQKVLFQKQGSGHRVRQAEKGKTHRERNVERERLE